MGSGLNFQHKCQMLRPDPSVSSSEAQRPFVFVQRNPRSATKVFTTFVARRIPSGDEHL